MTILPHDSTWRLRRSAERGFEDFGWTDKTTFSYHQLGFTPEDRRSR